MVRSTGVSESWSVVSPLIKSLEIMSNPFLKTLTSKVGNLSVSYSDPTEDKLSVTESDSGNKNLDFILG
jgi:hypothetical protein